MRRNESFGGRIVIYNKIITRKIMGGGGPLLSPPPVDPPLVTVRDRHRSATGTLTKMKAQIVMAVFCQPLPPKKPKIIIINNNNKKI